MPDGVGIRNYIYSSDFDKFDVDIKILHNFNPNTINDFSLHESIKLEQLKTYEESFQEKFYRELIHLVRLKYNAKIKTNSSILSNYMPKKNALKLKLFYAIVEFCSKFYISQGQIQNLEIQYQKAIRSSKVYQYYFNYFKEHQPTKLFCTHQRAVIAAPIFAAAKDAGIKTLTAIYSWDNLPKARLALRADEYLVWSPYMKDELTTYYPEIKDQQIKILGTPQFQFHYDDSYLWTKEKLAEFYDLDLNKKWLCFSGDDKTTSPFDPEYLQDIAEEIYSSGLATEWQILLRPVPVEGFDKYQEIIDRYPKIIKKTGADWVMSSNWSDVYPKETDLNILSSLCEHANAVINVGSTMALDFGMHHKPAIYLNYEVKPNSNWSIKRVYKFQHFRSMGELTPVIWLNDKKDLPEIIMNLGKYHQQTKEDMQTWCERIIPKELRVSSSHLINQYLINN